MINLTKTEYLELRNRGRENNDGYQFRSRNNPQKVIETISSEMPSDFFDARMYTINLLLQNREALKETRILLPDDIVSVDSFVKGWQRDFIEGKNLRKIIYNPKVPIETKISLLKQVGQLLRKMSMTRKNTHINNFYYNDLHEGNFIVDYQGIIHGIDIGSCKILDNTPTMALYPSLLSQSNSCPQKYQRNTQKCTYGATIIPDENLDIYCYIMMILGFMYGKQFDELKKDTLIEYLDYLEFYGGNLEFLEIISRIYDAKIDNTNPDYLLDYIKEIYPYSNYHYDKGNSLSKILR